jgi:hypothetical protein
MDSPQKMSYVSFSAHCSKEEPNISGVFMKRAAMAVLMMSALFISPLSSLAAAQEPESPQLENGDDPERQLRLLQALDYNSQEGKDYVNEMNAETFLSQFDSMIKNGYAREADAEIQRLALADLAEYQKQKIGNVIFQFNVRVLERTEPLVKNGFFDDYLSDDDVVPQALAYTYISYFNTQETVDDKLKAAGAFRRIFSPTLKERKKAIDPRYMDYLLPAFSQDDTSMYPGLGGTPPVIDFTSPPEKWLPEFSPTQSRGLGKAGKYLIVRRLKGGIKDTDYFIDLAMMSSLPLEYFPDDLSKVTRIVAIDTQWKQDGKFHNGTLAFTPASTINAYDCSSGKLIAKIGRLNEKITGTIFLRKDAEKYFDEVDKVAVCKMVVEWLNKKK